DHPLPQALPHPRGLPAAARTLLDRRTRVSRVDALDIYRSFNALAETTNGLYKTERVYGPDTPRPWENVDELELATLSWMHWFNEDRHHSYCDDVPPAELEAAFYAAQQTRPVGVGNQ
ncbi:integrase core domain-containing protein, partial [Rhabdothermincola sediminis]|uniref:integrase core domain-containing protein n=1 Tax=Rhabdothermincola sediminis TaxID=2751370 RepID=UPI001AA09070